MPWYRVLVATEVVRHQRVFVLSALNRPTLDKPNGPPIYSHEMPLIISILDYFFLFICASDVVCSKVIDQSESANFVSTLHFHLREEGMRRDAIG